MIRGGIARGRGGIARGTPSPGSHLSVSREILRWDGVGSTRCSHWSLSRTRGVQRGKPTTHQTNKKSRASPPHRKQSCGIKCALRGNQPKSLRGWRRSAGAYGETSDPRVPTSLVAHAGRQCRRSSTNVGDVGGGDVKKHTPDQAMPRAYARSALNAAPPTAFVRKFEWLSEPLMSSTRMRPSSIW